MKGAQMTAEVLEAPDRPLLPKPRGRAESVVTGVAGVAGVAGPRPTPSPRPPSWHPGPAAPWATVKDKRSKRGRWKPPILQDPLGGRAAGAAFPPFHASIFQLSAPGNMF